MIKNRCVAGLFYIAAVGLLDPTYLQTAVQAQEVIIDGDYDATVPSSFTYTYGRFSNTPAGAQGVTAGAGVGGTAANALDFTTAAGDFGGFGVFSQNFPPGLGMPIGDASDFSFSFDVNVEGTAGAESDLFIRMVIGGLPDDSVGDPDADTDPDQIQLQQPLVYDEMTGGFQAITGAFSNADIRPDATLANLLTLGHLTNIIQFGVGIDAGNMSGFGEDADNHVAIDNLTLTYTSSIPEPASLTLVILSLLSMLGLARPRCRRSVPTEN